MQLSSQYRYLFLDFETTGLDTTSDYPIQIALIEVDTNLQTIQHYSSYIALPEDSDSIKSNISYITGIQKSMLEAQGQDLAKVTQDIKGFFGDDVILIGQNISFDIKFLERFFPDLSFHDSIDTYELATSSLPYIGSYSLESIEKHITSRNKPSLDLKQSLLDSLSGDKALSNHDALYDCIVGIVFMQWFVDQIEMLTQQHPTLTNILHKTDKKDFSIFSMLELTNNTTDSQELSLPVLSSPSKQQTSENQTLATNRSKVPSESKFSSAGVNIKDIIPQLPKKSIIAVSHGSKIDIIRRAHPDINFGYIKAEQAIDHNKLSKRLHKESFSYLESLFVVFYLAHHREGYRVLSPRLGLHKYVLNYLQKDSQSIKTDKILCSLGGLYYTLEDQKRRQAEFADYTICILDVDRWHTSYNNYAQKGIQLDKTIFLREQELYRVQQNANNQQVKDFETLLTTWTMRLGYIGLENDSYLGKADKAEIAYLLTESDYSKTAGLWETIKQDRKDYVKTYENNQRITGLIHKINQLLLHPLLVRRRVSHSKEVSYSLAPSVRYIDFAEYIELFGKQKILFFSPSRQEYPQRLSSDKNNNTNTPTLLTDNNVSSSITHIKASPGSTFVISHNAHKSKKLFNALLEEGLDTVSTLIGEHITGGVHKAITQYDSTDDNIAIGGYHLLLQFWASGKTFDTIIIHSVYKSLSDIIKEDIKLYAPEKQKTTE